jgi:hypothetical protein
MYNVLKRGIIALTIIAVLMSSIVITVSVQADESDIPETEFAETKTVFYWDGDSDTVGRIDGDFSVISVDGEHNKSMAVSSAEGAQKLYFNSDNPQISEMDIVSFDLYCQDNKVKASTGLFMQDRDAAEKKMYYIRENETTTIQEAMEGARLAVPISTKKRSAKRWYHFDACIDYRERTVNYYIDGDGIGSNPLPEDYNICSGFSYLLESTGTGGVHILDNISIIQLMERGKEININKSISYPKSVTDPRIISNDQLGNIFFDRNVTFHIKTENRTEKDSEFKIIYEAINERGIAEVSESKKVFVEAGSEKTTDISLSVKGYGFYTLDVYEVNLSSNSAIHSKKAFSVANAPKDGLVNETMGVCNHFNMGHGVAELERKTELMKNAGFVGIREGYLWSDFEKTPGVYKKTDIHERADAALKENGMTRFVQLAVSNAAVTSEFPPVSDYAVKRFADYAYNVALQTKGLVEGVEVWNEWDIKTFNPSQAPVDKYVNLLKETYAAVKKANPDCKVYGMGGCTSESFMEEFFKNGGGEYCDGFSWHPYPGPMNSRQAYEKFMKWKDITVKYGYGDKPIVCSEFNWTSGFVSEDDQANYAIQYSAMTLGMIETLYWYVSQEKQGTTESEKHFGMIRAWDESEAAPYEPYSAKPEYLALANWNTLMIGAESVGKVDIDDAEITAYQFRSRTGEDVLIIWNDNMDAVPKTLSLDTNKITVYDRYGNKRQLASDNNCFSFSISKKPQYIFGDFSKVEISDNNASSSIVNFEITTNDEKSFAVHKDFDNDVDIQLDLPKNITAVHVGEFENNYAKITLKTGTNPADTEVITVRLVDKLTKTERWSYDIPVRYNETAGYRIYATRFRSRRWNCNFTVKNNTSSRRISGKVIFDGPDFMKGKVYEFSGLQTGAVNTFAIPIPESLGDVKQEVKGKLILESGEEYDFNNVIYFTNFVETDTPPTIDGVLEKNEWQIDAPFKLMYKEQVKRISPWSLNDCSGKIYCMWDKQYFYIAGAIQDDVLGDNDPEKRIWANDSIQFSFTEEPVSGAKQTEYGIGLVDGEAKVERYSYFGVDAGMLGQEDKFKGDGIDVQITRDEDAKTTYYEARFPWIEIFGKPISPASYDEFYFSLLVNDNDGNGRRGWMEFCPGIGETKDSAAFESIPVVRKNVW